MHVDQQVLNLLLVERLAERRHFAASKTDDFAYPVVIGGQNVVINPISGPQQFYRLSQ